MTQLQKDIIELLFKGHSIAAYGNTYRLRDQFANPVQKFTFKTFDAISGLLRYQKGVYVLDKGAVRKKRKSSWVKKYYNEQLKSKQWNGKQ